MKKLIILLTCAIGIPALAQSSIELELKNNYLNLPVSYDEDHSVSLELVVGDKVVRYLDIYLPDGDPDFWVFIDIRAWKGKDATLRTGEGEEKKGSSLGI